MQQITLRQMRRFKEVTQEEMARILGVHVQTYRHIEKNPGSATIEQARLILTRLGVQPDEIFFA